MVKIVSRLVVSVLLVCLCLFFTETVQAQSGADLTIRLHRDMGFGAGNQIQGVFSLTATGPTDLTRVIFLIDGQPMGEVTQAPFKLQFNTNQYATTSHVFSARGYTSPGAELTSNEIPVTILSMAEAGRATIKTIAFILAFVLVFTLLYTLVIGFLNQGKLNHLPPGTERNYGIAGGTICPRCHRPYARSALAPNLVVGKLTRCPYCGKIALTRHYSLRALRQAEIDELKNAPSGGQIHTESEEEKLRKGIDNSRYL